MMTWLMASAGVPNWAWLVATTLAGVGVQTLAWRAWTWWRRR